MRDDTLTPRNMESIACLELLIDSFINTSITAAQSKHDSSKSYSIASTLHDMSTLAFTKC